MKHYKILLLLIAFWSCKSTGMRTNKDDRFLEKLFKSDSTLKKFLTKKDALKIQVLYTRIDRDAQNKPILKDFSYNLADSNYFYPASTVKMPVALLALEKLNELNIKGLNSNSIMNAGVRESADETKLIPLSVAHHIKEIFLISDNNAFNTLYEFTGQQYINEKLIAKGYNNTEIRHRLQIALTEEQNRKTNRIDFYDDKQRVLYSQPAARSNFEFKKRSTFLGDGYIKEDSMVKEPLNFSAKNKASITDLHNVMRAIIMPETVDPNSRFNLTADDYHLLYRYMSAYPEESANPKYDTANYYRNYSKFIFFGAEKSDPPPYIRVFNKEGDAYGFLTDIAYIVDFKSKVEFFLSATIYCNSDGIFNDDKYDYENVGFPFLKQLGQVIYQYELKRKRKNVPDLDKFKMDYSAE